MQEPVFVTRTLTKTIIDSLQNKLHDTIYENAKLRAQLFDKVSDQKDTACGTRVDTKFAKQSILGKPPKVGETHALSKPVTSNSIPTPQGSKVVKNVKVIAPGMFRINPFKPSREDKHVPNKVRASVMINPITVSQPPVITKKVENSNSNGLYSTGLDNTKTRRPQPRSNKKNDRVPSVSKSSRSKNKEVKVEEHHRKLLLSRNKKHMSSKCNNIKLATQNVKSKVVCVMWQFYGSDLEVAFRRNACFIRNLEDDYSHYTWVHFLRSKDKAPEVIKSFLKRITILLQSPIIIIRTDNGTEFKNQVLKEYFDSVGVSHQVSSVRTPQQNGVVERKKSDVSRGCLTMLIFSRVPLFLWAKAIATACFTQNHSIIHRRFNKTPYELINGRKPDIFFLHVFEALCYPMNDCEDIRKLGAKGDIGFFIGYYADSCAFRVSKPELQSMNSGQISSGLGLTYAPSIITTQQPPKGEMDLLFEAMYDDYIGGQPSTAP
nr:retrovirus-related Pol polyprotein from transposon TNT 1-94 [Tanacetum cinerariifolium]